jgi:hypothetical protein
VTPVQIFVHISGHSLLFGRLPFLGYSSFLGNSFCFIAPSASLPFLGHSSHFVTPFVYFPTSNSFLALFLFDYLHTCLFYIFLLTKAERRVQRRANSASDSETTLRVRCNVCCAPMLKHEYAKQTKNADLRQTSAEQDKARQNKQIATTFCKTIN